MKKSKGLALLLVLVFLLCLIPATALAAPEEAADAEEAEEETLSEEAAEEAADAEDAESAEEAAEEEEDEEAPAEPVTVAEEETYYAAASDLVYNNGGTVYANGGTVYNNGGTVYANGGTVYNNAGIVYANGGTVYNNAGTVYNNGALIYSFEGDVEEARIYGTYRISTAEDYSAFADFEGLTPEGYLGKDQACTILPHEGFVILEAEADAGVLTENENGSYTLDQVDDDLTLTLRFQAAAPVLDLEPGTYAEAKTLTITAPEGTEIRYTTDGSEPDEENGTLYTEPLSLTESVTVKAVALAEGAEPSTLSAADYAFIAISAPEFEEVEEGYTPPAAAGFTVENSGSVDAVIESVALDGKDAASFTINTKAGATVKAGATNSSSWTIRPVKGLAKGSYTATVTFTLDSGETVELPIKFSVK